MDTNDWRSVNTLGLMANKYSTAFAADNGGYKGSEGDNTYVINQNSAKIFIKNLSGTVLPNYAGNVEWNFNYSYGNEFRCWYNSFEALNTTICKNVTEFKRTNLRLILVSSKNITCIQPATGVYNLRSFFN